MMAVFQKGQRLRMIGHLDLMRAMQRALRRSELPVSYSQGYNPHILLTFASALSTGAWGQRELMDAAMDAEVSPEVFLRQLNDALPADLRVVEAAPLDDRHGALMAMTAGARYRITLTDAEVAAKLAACRDAFLADEEIMTERKTKSAVRMTNIRPLIYDLSVEGQDILATLCLTAETSCKTDMLLKAWCAKAECDAPRAEVCRLQLLGRDESGALQPLETL